MAVDVDVTEELTFSSPRRFFHVADPKGSAAAARADPLPKGGGDDPGSAQPERSDAMEYVARVLAQIPAPRKHLVRYHGYYSCASRGKQRKAHLDPDPQAAPAADANTEEPPPISAEVAASKRRWADLIRRIYEVDPLVCRCGGTMKIISFITDPPLVERILDHLRRTQARSRGSPEPTPSPALA